MQILLLLLSFFFFFFLPSLHMLVHILLRKYKHVEIVFTVFMKAKVERSTTMAVYASTLLSVDLKNGDDHLRWFALRDNWFLNLYEIHTVRKPLTIIG